MKQERKGREQHVSKYSNIEGGNSGLGDVTVKAKGENMERPKENNLTSRRYENPNKRKTDPTISSL